MAALLKTSPSIYVVGAKRTPFGAFGGKLKKLSATELGVASTTAALAQAGLDPAAVGVVYFGNVIATGPDAPYLARHVGLKSGIPVPVPALTLNRLCGSGFETVAQGAKSILNGEASVAVCGGAENMSAAPYQVDGNSVRWGVNLGTELKMRDSLWDGLTDMHAGCPMGITAENLAEQYGITRQECDEFAIRSQQLWGKANEAGVFDLEMAPLEVKGRKGVETVDTDEHPRPETALEKIAKLRPVFKKDGTVTAASASGICDGAGTIVLASEEAVKEHGLTPLARLSSFHVAGCEPTSMGIGPVPAILGALEHAGIHSVKDADRVEINEAFAAQFLACAKELDLDMDKTNVNGGAISIGHPLGASGSRITAHLANEFQRADGNIHIGAACIGGGQGIAVVLERA